MNNKYLSTPRVRRFRHRCRLKSDFEALLLTLTADQLTQIESLLQQFQCEVKE
jgi:hypothetical protein